MQKTVWDLHTNVMLFDLHVHTTISVCSQLQVSQILARASERGLDGVCLTDHDSMAIGLELEEGLQSNGLCVIVGMEYATSQGDFLLFGPFEDLRPGLLATDLLILVQQRRGVAIAAHPFRENRPADPSVLCSGLCHGIEVANGRNTPGENALSQGWATNKGLPQTGGSDAHTLAELGRCGTRFRQPVRNRAEFIQALLQGCFEPCSTPLCL